MDRITSIKGRIVYNSRGSETVEVDVIVGDIVGRVCAPSGASVGRHEASSLPKGAANSIKTLHNNAAKFVGLDVSDLKLLHDTIQDIDNTSNYSEIGGAIAFAVTIAAADAAAKITGAPLFASISDILDTIPSSIPSGVSSNSSNISTDTSNVSSTASTTSKKSFRFPYPLGNILGGGAHAGPGTPDIQEILVCAIGADNIRDAISTNLKVHKELQKIIQRRDPNFTNGRGDEGGWAPRMNNQKALEVSAQACESLGYTLGREVALGVDFAASTQWDESRAKYVYDRAGFENTPGEQIDFAADIIKQFKLIYAEDAVHEEAFTEMSELTSKFPDVMITGDDLTVTNSTILDKAISQKSCNAAILKVNQAGSLYAALQFADLANKNDIRLITSHRSGESNDSHISHIGIATGSKLLKVGVVGGERVAKLNELLRLSGHDLICGMAEV